MVEKYAESYSDNEDVLRPLAAIVDNKNNIFERNNLIPDKMGKARVAAGCDHAGIVAKDAIVKMLKEAGYEVIDKGTFSSESVDYPDFAHSVARSVESAEADLGVLVCGSANGVAITANKHSQIRAAIAWRNDVAALARQHNNANIICIPARFVTTEEAIQFVKTFLQASFEGGRHQKRVEKIALAK